MGLLLHLAVEAHDFLLQLLHLVEQITQVLARLTRTAAPAAAEHS